MSIFSKKIIGLSITSTSVQVAELEKRFGKYYVMSSNRVSIPTGYVRDDVIINRKGMIGLIDGLFQTAKPRAINKKFPVVLALPGNNAFIHTFRFSRKISSANIERVLPYEAEQHIPYQADEIIWDFSILPSESQDKYREAIYVAIPKRIVHSHWGMLEDLGLSPQLFCLASEAYTASLSTECRRSNKAVAILNLGYVRSNLTITKDRAIRSSADLLGAHELLGGILHLENFSLAPPSPQANGGAHSDTDHGTLDKYKKLLEKLEQIISFYRAKDPEADVAKIILTGQFFDAPGLADYLDENSQLDIEIGKIKSSVIDKTGILQAPDDIAKPSMLQETPKVHKEITSYEKESQYYAAAIGAALLGFKPHYFYRSINLLPENVKEGVQRARLLRFVKWLCPCIILFFASITLLFSMAYQRHHYQLIEVRDQSKNLKQIVDSVRYSEISDAINGFNAELLIIKKLDDACYPIVSILEILKEQMPEYTEITSISFHEDDHLLELSGVAKHRNDIIRIQQNFESLEYVLNVHSPVSNLDKKRNASFIMKIYFDPEKMYCDFFRSSSENSS